jgi:hypothetical protein
MKNKHLVLLFLGVLALGLLARRLPWPAKKLFQTDLIALDTATVTQISILSADQPELLLERTEAGWAATQELHSLPVRQEDVAPVLAALSAVRSLRIVRTNLPDTLGISEANRLQVIVFQENKILEQFEIGNETLENGQPATFVRLLPHEGIYLAKSHLRSIFSKQLDDFRPKTVAQFEPSQVRAIALENSTLKHFFLQKNDLASRWKTPEKIFVSNDSVQLWLALFSRLNGAPFADFFDESRARETQVGKTTLHLISSDSLVFRIFHEKASNLPEQISPSRIRFLAPYIFHSSQNPTNFFTLPDTSLLRKIFLEPTFLKIAKNGN